MACGYLHAALVWGLSVLQSPEEFFGSEAQVGLYLQSRKLARPCALPSRVHQSRKP